MRFIRTHNRSGLSLLEILAAVFVVSIAIMGILAVIPFGGYRMAQMNRADYSGNCGRAAMAFIDTTGWASDPLSILSGDDNVAIIIDPEADPLIPPTAVSSRVGGITGGAYKCFIAGPVLVDPMGIRFEASGPLPSGLVRSSAGLNDQQFFWFDDVNYEAPDDSSVSVNNPRPIIITNTGDGSTSRGAYTWLFMLTPKPYNEAFALYSSDGYIAYDDIVGFDLDVIVCQRRSGKERILNAEIVSSGTGGGRVKLTGTEEELSFKNIDWILLCGTYPSLATSWDAEGVVQTTIDTPFSKWYRIASKGSIIPVAQDVNYRELTLIGPDIPSFKTGTVPQVFIIEGAASVFSKTVQKK